jgi:hypothetical protein
LAQAYHLLGESQMACKLLGLAFKIHFGKAGLMVPARLSQAETARICGLSFAPILEKARDSAHNIQDPTFCALTTARYNAMRTRWWDPVLNDPQGKPLHDLEATIDQLLKQPHSPAFCALHDPQETYSQRGVHGFNTDLPYWMRHPGSLPELALLYGCQPEELHMLNPDAAGNDQIHIPDHEMAAWIAARLAAEVLVAYLPQNKDPLLPLMKLVPPVEYYPTCLDAVLARLLLGSAPHIDSNLLEQLVEVNGDPYNLLMKKLADDLGTMGNVNEFVG